MTTPQPSITFAYNNTAQRWFDTASGKFVSEIAVVDEMRLHQTATYNVLDNVTRQLYAGQLTLEQWQYAVAAELKDAHLAQAMFAVGGKRIMSQANYGRVGGTLADEYRYLNQFAIDIQNGYSEKQALARIRQYGNATQQSYWNEYELATPPGEVIYWMRTPGESCSDCIELEAGSPYEPGTMRTHPGAGATKCRGNCNCIEERRKR